jgi:hypothetical protein
MDEATIEDLAFSSRSQGKPGSPAGCECLSTEGIKKVRHLLDSLSLKLRFSRRSSAAADEGGEGMAFKI